VVIQLLPLPNVIPVNGPREECDDGNQATEDGCTPGCTREVNCEDCTELRCAEHVKACSEISAESCGAVCTQASMDAMQDCILNADCGVMEASGNYSTLGCFCPAGMDALTCTNTDIPYLKADPQAGPCIEEVRAAFCNPSTGGPATSSHVMFNFVDPEFPGGTVNAWLKCRALECAAECAGP
jgi:cysteine-rich repeat protein